MSLTSMIFHRCLMLVLVTFGVSLITFFISRVIPGDPAQMIAGPRATAEMVEAIRVRLGLDAPLSEQYLSYISDLLRGDLGVSITSQLPVAAELFGYMPATAELMIFALLISVVVGIPLGVLTAVNKNTLLDSFFRGTAILGISSPSFWLSLMLLLFFYNYLGVLPGSGRLDVGVTPPPFVTGFYLIDSALAGDWLAFRSSFNHLILPALTLSLTSIGTVIRIVRSSMIDELGEDYIRTARGFGLSKNRIVYIYALRNALIPFVTILGLELATLLFGSVVIESVFAWPGVGKYVLNAILNLDFPVIMGFTVLASIVYVTANLIVDIIYLYLDPKIREAQ